MISESDESIVSSESSKSCVVPDRVQKLLEKLRKERNTERKNNEKIITAKKTEDSRKIKVDSGKILGMEQVGKRNLVTNSFPNIGISSEKFLKNEIKKVVSSKYTSAENILQQDGISNDSKEALKDKLRSLDLDTSDTSTTTTESEESAKKVSTYKKSFNMEIAGKQYAKHKMEVKGKERDSEFAKRKAEEWLCDMTRKDGKKDLHSLEVGDTSSSDESSEPKEVKVEAARKVTPLKTGNRVTIGKTPSGGGAGKSQARSSTPAGRSGAARGGKATTTPGKKPPPQPAKKADTPRPTVVKTPRKPGSEQKKPPPVQPKKKQEPAKASTTRTTAPTNPVKKNVRKV